MQELVLHKQKLFPSLRRVMLWKPCELSEFSAEEERDQEENILQNMDVSQDFEKAGIEFSIKVSHQIPEFQNPSMWGL